MRFSIITPSLQRESLVRCCESIHRQTFANGWEHIVQIDAVDLDTELMKKIEHPQRHIACCGTRHNNFGNTCRHLAWEVASGEWIIYLDDDNYLADNRILGDISGALRDITEHWAIFSIMRHGSIFFNDPPGLCMTDTMNLVVRRDIGQWPDIEAREADGHFTEQLKKQYPYKAFPNFRPIGVMEKSSNGT